MEGEDAQFQFLATSGQAPEAIEEGTAVVEVVRDEAAGGGAYGGGGDGTGGGRGGYDGIEAGTVTSIGDREKWKGGGRVLLTCKGGGGIFTRELCCVAAFSDLDAVNGSLLPVLLGGSCGDLGLAFLNGTRGASLQNTEKGNVGTLQFGALWQVEVFGLITTEQIDVITDRTRESQGFDVVQRPAVLKDNGRGNPRNLHQANLAIATGNQLSGGIAEARHVHGEDGSTAGRDGDRFLREADAAGLKLYGSLGREVGEALVVIEEDEGGFSIGTHRPAQRRVVGLLQILRCREGGLHGCQQLAEVLHEEMQGAQAVVLRIGLAELTQRSLEVIGADGQVVVGGEGGGLALVEGVQAAFGVAAAVVHVISKEVAAAAQFHQRHGIGILGIDVGAAVVGRGHSASKFAGEVGVSA